MEAGLPSLPDATATVWSPRLASDMIEHVVIPVQTTIHVLRYGNKTVR